jgi:U2 small nuclear ribonucleoprotein B''
MSQDPNYLQKIQYAKGRSNVFNKLEGVYRPPTTTAPVTSTELQQSIFNAPPSSVSATTAAVTGISATTPIAAETSAEETRTGPEGPQGSKRRREDDSDQEEAPMEEDDDDVSMEASSDEE